MIVDVFLFHDEFDMLRCRGYELEGVVDMHIAVEGSRTMSGEEREFRLTGDEIPNLHVIQADLSDVSDIELPYRDVARSLMIKQRPGEEYPYVDNWKRDWKQRLAADEMVAGLPAGTTVMYGDVDEIPKRDRVEAFAELGSSVYTLGQALLIYGTGWSVPHAWSGTVIGPKEAHLAGFSRARQLRGSFPHLEDGGWHLSWFGGRQAVVDKVKVFAHGEMAEDIDRVISDYDQRIWPGSDAPLTPYEGELPRWVQDGFAPTEWTNPG